MMTDPNGKSAMCDKVIVSAAEAMVRDGASMGLMLDRLLTYAAAQAVALNGSGYVAAGFRAMADRIDAGLFMHLETVPGRGRH